MERQDAAAGDPELSPEPVPLVDRNTGGPSLWPVRGGDRYVLRFLARDAPGTDPRNLGRRCARPGFGGGQGKRRKTDVASYRMES